MSATEAGNKQADQRPGRLDVEESAFDAGRVRVTDSEPVDSGADLHFKLCS